MAAKKRKYPIKFIGTSWTLQADNGECSQTIGSREYASVGAGKSIQLKGVRGYATEAVSARTHEFIFYPRQHLRAAELFRMRPLVPEYIRRKLGGLMRQVHASKLAERKSS
jgi:hypothetical protein